MNLKRFLAILTLFHRDQANLLHDLVLQGANMAKIREAMNFGAEVEAMTKYFHQIADEHIVSQKWLNNTNYIETYADAVGRTVQELEVMLDLPGNMSREELAVSARDLYFKRMETDVSRIVTTESTRMLAEAVRENCTKYRYVTAGDMAVCPYCRDLEGMVISAEEAQVGMNLPPMHPNCRCHIVKEE